MNLKMLTELLGRMFFDKPDNDTDAEQRTGTLCIPYVRGASDRLRKQLAKEGVNVVFRKGQTLGKYLINGGPPKNNRRKNVVYKIPCDTCSFCYIGETSQWFDEREVQHKRSMKNCDTNNGIYMHILDHPDHVMAWEKATILDYDRNYYARRMKTLLYTRGLRSFHFASKTSSIPSRASRSVTVLRTVYSNGNFSEIGWHEPTNQPTNQL